MKINQKFNKLISFKENSNVFLNSYASNKISENPTPAPVISDNNKNIPTQVSGSQTTTKGAILAGTASVGGLSGYFTGEKNLKTILTEKFKTDWFNKEPKIIELAQNVINKHKLRQEPENHEKIIKLTSEEFIKLPKNKALRSKYKLTRLAVGLLAGLAVGFIANMFIKDKK